jgi:hypothetical protein
VGYADPDEQREYQRVWNAERRAAWFADKSCLQCGSTERLELDHIDPSTKVSHSVWSWKLARRLVELAKCQPLCHDCHLAKTALARMPAHGKVSRYDRHKCRCALCRSAKKLASARYRKPRVSAGRASKATATPFLAPVIILRPERVTKPSFVNTQEVAKMLGLSVPDFRRVIETGRFPRPHKSTANGPLWRIKVVEGFMGDEDELAA